MTPEITCSIVFGIVASVLALVTILQTHRKALASGMIIPPCGVLGRQNTKQSALTCGVSETSTEPRRVWYGHTPTGPQARSYSLPSFMPGSLTPLPPAAQYHIHGRHYP